MNEHVNALILEDWTQLPPDPLVTVRCITYNHVNFITDAIEGFLIQKTDFPVEILIHDDASTDGTAEIVRAYQAKHPHLIRAVLQSENQYSQGRFPFNNTLGMARGKYIALCEGDDYWTDSEKLQLQADYLEAHPDITICFHPVFRRFEDQDRAPDIYPKFVGNQIFTKADLYSKNIIQTCSVLFRAIQLNEYYEKRKFCKIGDWPLFLYLAQHGDIGYLDQKMAVYRIHKGSLNSGKSHMQNVEIVNDVFRFFLSFDGIENHPKMKETIARNYLILLQYYIKGEFRSKKNLAFINSFILLKYLNGDGKKQWISLFFQSYFPEVRRIYHKTFKNLSLRNDR